MSLIDRRGKVVMTYAKIHTCHFALPETAITPGEDEGIYLAPFGMERIRDYRIRETWGNAFRRPHRYGLLTSLEVEEPFVRVNASGEAYDRGKR